MVKEVESSLVSRFSYNQPYIEDIQKFKKDILNKTYIPHQVEVQPGPKGKALCWLQCPYCYGGSAKNTGELLNDKRYIEVLREIAEGYVTAKYESPQNSVSNDIISSEDEVSSSMSFPKVADKDDDNVTIEDLDDEIEELDELDDDI